MEGDSDFVLKLSLRRLLHEVADAMMRRRLAPTAGLGLGALLLGGLELLKTGSEAAPSLLQAGGDWGASPPGGRDW